MLKVVEFKQELDKDPVATMYRRVRDIILSDNQVPQGMCIAILELVKNELIGGIQSEIDAVKEQE